MRLCRISDGEELDVWFGSTRVGAIDEVAKVEESLRVSHCDFKRSDREVS